MFIRDKKLSFFHAAAVHRMLINYYIPVPEKSPNTLPLKRSCNKFL